MVNELEVTISKDFEEWENFLLKEECGNIFQSALMSPAYLEALKMNMYLITACMKGKNVGGMLVYERVPLKLPPLVNELHTAYGPIVSEAVDDVVKREVLEALLKSAANIANHRTIRHTFFVRSDLIYGPKMAKIQTQAETRVLAKTNYKRILNGYAQTFVVDLEQSSDSLYRNFEKRARWAMNKAKKLSVRVFKDNTNEGLRLFYKLYVNTAKRHKAVITPFAFLDKLYNILSSKKMFDIYLAYFDAIPISATIILNYKDTAYYYMSGSAKEYDFTQASTYLQHFVMNDAKTRGLKKYDLLCAPSPEDIGNSQYGLYLFKRSFGGRNIPVFHCEKVFNRWLQVFEDKLLQIYARLL